MDFSTIIIVFAVLSVIGTLLFWGTIAALVYKLFSSSDSTIGGGASPFVNPDAAFMAELQQLEAIIRQARAAQGHHGAATRELPPQLQMQFQTNLLRMQNDMGHLDNLSRQRHDSFVSGMLGDASAAGLDVSSWN